MTVVNVSTAVSDILVMKSLALTPRPPQTQVYAGYHSFITLNMTLSNLGDADIPTSETLKPLFIIQVE